MCEGLPCRRESTSYQKSVDTLSAPDHPHNDELITFCYKKGDIDLGEFTKRLEPKTSALNGSQIPIADPEILERTNLILQ